MALREEKALPRGVLGPLERAPLMRACSECLSEIMMGWMAG